MERMLDFSFLYGYDIDLSFLGKGDDKTMEIYTVDDLDLMEKISEEYEDIYNTDYNKRMLQVLFKDTGNYWKGETYFIKRGRNDNDLEDLARGIDEFFDIRAARSNTYGLIEELAVNISKPKSVKIKGGEELITLEDIVSIKKFKEDGIGCRVDYYIIYLELKGEKEREYSFNCKQDWDERWENLVNTLREYTDFFEIADKIAHNIHLVYYRKNDKFKYKINGQMIDLRRVSGLYIYEEFGKSSKYRFEVDIGGSDNLKFAYSSKRRRDKIVRCLVKELSRKTDFFERYYTEKL